MALTDLSASDLSRMIAARDLAPSELMSEVLDHIDQTNPALNAIISLRDRESLMAEATSFDNAPPTGWLHGLPMAVKDLLATKGLRTTWGSPLFADFVPQEDDLLAARMRAAGAIFIGKTNTPEWGHGSHSFNPVHGVTRNPYDPSRTAGGSSGGAAAALAARMVAVADGSDMMGSLRNPAAFCNVYGFRPTWGLVPGDAVGDTFLSTLATEGPMARTVEDIGRLLTTQTGENPRVPFPRPQFDWANLSPKDMKGLRMAWVGNWSGAYQMEPGILDLCEAALHQFEDMGAIVEPIPAPYPAEKLWQSWTILRSMLNAGGLRALYDDPAKRARLKPETIWEIEQGLPRLASEVYAASVTRSDWYAKAARLFDRFDLVVMPSAQVWPFPVEWRWPETINGKPMDTYHRWMEVVIPVSLIGLPSLSIPIGFGASGLPMGMQLIGRSGDDKRVLEVGEAWHRATDWPRQRPPHRM